MQASPVLRLLAFVLALSTFGSATLAHAQETFVYRDGLDGYAGTRSVNISSLGLADTGFGMNGTTFTDGGDWCIGDLPDTMGYDISPLLRFEGLAPLEGHRLASATLRLRVVWWETGAPRVVVRYLAVPWDASAPDGEGVGVGWRTRAAGVPWSELGAEGEGTDVLEGYEALSEPLGVGEQTIAIALEPALVERWLDASQNFGVVLHVDTPNHHVGFVPPLSDDQAHRPELELVFAPADPPPDTDLPEPPGAAERFDGCAVRAPASEHGAWSRVFAGLALALALRSRVRARRSRG